MDLERSFALLQSMHGQGFVDPERESKVRPAGACRARVVEEMHVYQLGYELLKTLKLTVLSSLFWKRVTSAYCCRERAVSSSCGHSWRTTYSTPSPESRTLRSCSKLRERYVIVKYSQTSLEGMSRPCTFKPCARCMYSHPSTVEPLWGKNRALHSDYCAVWC